MEAAIERLAAIAFVVTGLSHIAAPRAWARFFIDMHARGPVGGLLNAYLHFPIGALIAAFHPVWQGPGLVVTLLGWALLLKATLYFMWPGLALRSLARVSEERVGGFRAAGVFALVLGLWMGWIAWG